MEKYIESAAAGNWSEVFDTLTGEALSGAKANTGRVKAGERIVSKSLKAEPVCKDIVEVSADFTKSAGGQFDRQAYKFRLKKMGRRWLIYSTTYGEYHHGDLKPGQLPPKAAEAVKTYMELSVTEKRIVNTRRGGVGVMLKKALFIIFFSYNFIF